MLSTSDIANLGIVILAYRTIRCDLLSCLQSSAYRKHELPWRVHLLNRQMRYPVIEHNSQQQIKGDEYVPELQTALEPASLQHALRNRYAAKLQ